jgi:hypothetical protein
MGLSERSLAKARRLADEGRVVEVTATRTFAVKGDHDVYLVTVSPDGAECSCPAYGECSHARAAVLTMGGLPEPPTRTDRQPPPAIVPEGRLFTGSWRRLDAYEHAGLVPVRISLGLPRWLPEQRARSYPYMSELAPAGIFHVEPIEEFTRLYVERLEAAGVARIDARFQAIAAAHDGRPLVLCCFEAERRDCHRGDFAAWWLQRTSEVVPEFEARR